MNDALASAPTAQMVPGDFAEKAMASLMSLHSELMDEKERRVELYRKLMEREPPAPNRVSRWQEADEQDVSCDRR